MEPSEKFFEQLSGRVDSVNGVIHGVSIITGGVTARGHDLEVDMKTVTQLFGCAHKMGKVPVKWNHKSGADAVAGYLENFRIDGQKLLGDWHLLKFHEKYDQALELAQRMPECIGLSAAFLGEDEKRADGKTAARCEELVSVDVVANPAANPNGFFEALFPTGVDTPNKNETLMQTQTNPQQQAEPTLKDVLAAVTALTSQVTQQGETIAALQGASQGNQQEQELSIEDLLTLTPQQIAQFVQEGHITDEDAAGIHGLQAEALAGGEGGQEGGHGNGGEGAAAAVGATAGGAEFASLRKQVRELSARFEREDAARENAAIEHYFGQIETKLTELSTQNQKLSDSNKELQVRCDAQAQALRTGIRPVAFSAEGAALHSSDGKLHEFEELVKKHRDAGKTPAQAIRLAQKENPAAHRDYYLGDARTTRSL
jgi:uncharacterized protein YcfJ